MTHRTMRKSHTARLRKKKEHKSTHMYVCTFICCLHCTSTNDEGNWKKEDIKLNRFCFVP